MRKTETMVQLSPSRTLETLTPSELTVEKDDGQGSPKPESPRMLSALQLALSSTTVYCGYEKYIEDGLICLKHKIRNIEKKKLKLERYSDKLKKGEKLNEDQLEAVGKYDEVVHNLKFAKELQKTIGSLTQDLLKAQRKAVRQEKQMKTDEEKSRLSLMLQVQYVLHSLQREDVRKNFCNTRQYSCYMSTQDMEGLMDLASLVGCKRDYSISLEDQMRRAAIVYWELLEGNEKPVAGSTYKHMKEKLLRLVDSGFFDNIPLPKSDSQEKTETIKPDSQSRPSGLTTLVKLSSNEVPSKEFLNRRYMPETDERRRGETASPRNWKEDFLAMKEREPPDSWEMEELADPPASSQSPIQKPWKGAAGLIPKTVDIVKRSTTDPKEKRQRKKAEQDSKSMPVAVEVFSSPSPLPKDPVQRRQQLETLMDQISGSFSFMQESLLDGESSPVNTQTKRCRPSPGSSTPIVQRELTKSPSDILPSSQRSTPLRILLSGEGKGCLSNGDRSINGSDLELHSEDKPRKQAEGFNSPPLYRRGSSISVSLENQSTVQAGRQMLCNGVSSSGSAQTFSTPPSRRSISAENPFHNIHSVFNVIGESSGMKADESGFSESIHRSFTSAKTSSVTTASTQTPPELNPPEEDLQIEGQYPLECAVSAGGPVFSSSHSRVGQSCYSRGAVRGGYDAYRVNVRSPGGSFMSQTHREPASALYMARENGYQQNFKRGAGTATQRSSAGWSDSSQVSSPDRDGAYPLDSGLSDTLSIPAMEVPMNPQGPHTLMPVHVYPLTQLRVAFSAARTANFAPGTLDQPIAFDLLHTNLGDMFDTGSGRFTCPATGAYVFIFHILKLAISVPLYINLMRNEEVMVSAYANDGAPDHETASNHAVLQLFQGDQVWLRLHRGAIYGSSWKYSTFSGFLLYQD
ncbi:caprin-2 [Danio rerio]|uniref:Caprin-2 n=3 Tax=Danio rerio TaxID=7955 RepID=CAPR2_DANRE|nr:caprin-2 [Danio rerio]Q5RJ80.1 RecName: Full=Caprin-2; AltName: Full=RNA granule protein 140 [Danio rerio]AAI71714.1 Caprin family member 2 [Danio rerio]FAA00697.1 TPA: RNA granule protein 140 [Danio rerio]|eukprot:NP_001013291.1 caprin-2 [Danio rerio]